MSLSASGPAAEALTLYSYTDGQGRVVVVDSLDKVPPAFRAGVRAGGVRSFDGSAGRPAGQARLEAVPDGPVVGPGGMRGSSVGAAGGEPGALTLAPPPPETGLATDPAWASASLWLAELDAIQDDGEKAWAIARVREPTHDRVLYLRVEALQRLDRLRPFEAMNWERAPEWVVTAKALTNQFRIVFWTISRWVGQGGGALVTELPQALTRTRAVLDKLHRDLPGAMVPVPSGTSGLNR
ncbi:MAG: hypothetical protein GX442_01755 [Candidatus Riflebacteria bacterium]|nr:hypothetical protein [Candidatus Riflebacteria bacterium]